MFKGDSKFILDKLTGKLYLNGSLDFEQKQQYLLTITALDPYLPDTNFHSSTTRLIIDVLDLNDNAPQFDPSTPSQFYVNENTVINTTIYHLMAYDLDKSVQNSALIYHLVTENSLFELDRDSGRLYTKSSIDYEKLLSPNFTLTIECSDQSERQQLNQLTIRVNVLDLNDNSPQFERPNQTLIFKENFPLGQEITRLRVFDRDGTTVNQGPFSFQIINDDQQDQIFAIRKNGSLILTKRPFKNVTYYLNGK